MPTKYVIIGAGPAGLNAANTIKQRDKKAKIVIISSEPLYSRMLLPYYLSGEIPLSKPLIMLNNSFVCFS